MNLYWMIILLRSIAREITRRAGGLSLRILVNSSSYVCLSIPNLATINPWIIDPFYTKTEKKGTGKEQEIAYLNQKLFET